jgi:hypothetical protein
MNNTVSIGVPIETLPFGLPSAVSHSISPCGAWGGG